MDRERILKTFFDLVQIDSETGNEKAVAEYLEEILKGLGFAVAYDDANKKFPSNTGNLIAKRGDTTAQSCLLLSAHMDTVVPGIGVKPSIEGDYIVSDGTTILGGDDKAGVTAIIEGIQLADRSGAEIRPLEIVFCIAEEGGLNGSKYLDYSKVDAKRALVFDSGGEVGNIITRGPGQDKIDIIVKGKAAHAGVAPENGISAIQVASEAISKMKLLRIDDDTTANIGIIQGGEATNIVCSEVVVKAEARSRSEEKLNAQTAHMVDCFKRAAAENGTAVEIDVARVYQSFSVEDDSEIVKLVANAMQRIDITPNCVASGGGSDTNNYNNSGIAAVNIAVGMERVHTVRERIKVESLLRATELVAELVKEA